MKSPALNADERRALRAQAHHLDPVVMIGNDGLTPAVRHEIDINLLAHGLIKIRVFNDDRAEREAMLQRIAMELQAAPVQHIGKLLVVYRPIPEAERAMPSLARKRRVTTAPGQARASGARGSARSAPRPDAGAPQIRRRSSRMPVVIESRQASEPAAARTPRAAAIPRGAPKSPRGAGETVHRGDDRKRSGGTAKPRSGGGPRPRSPGIPGRRRRTGG